MKNNGWIADVITIEEDQQHNSYLQFPVEIMNQLGWQQGDLLVWNIEDDGTITIKKKEDDK
jgi:alpha-glucosidase (family GH31 glycosyl hydrolase)